MRLPLELMATADDDAAYIDLVDRTINGLVHESPPRDIWVVRIDNWFGRRWCAFSGKILGALGVWRTERLVVPPFVPSRVEAVHYLQRVIGGYRAVTPAVDLHRSQPSERNTRRFLEDLSSDGLFVWYAGRSAKNGRGSMMAYRVRLSEQHGWHVELRLRSRRWAPSSLVGVSPAELEGWAGRSRGTFAPASRSRESPHVVSAELKSVADAFRRKSKSLGYADDWTCEHTMEGGERLDIDFDVSRGATSVRLSFWSDGAMWVRAARRADGANAGWAFVWAFHGRWTAVRTAQLVEIYEASRLHLVPSATSESAFLDVWSPVLPTIDAAVHRAMQ